MSIFRIILACESTPESEGDEVARDIADEFVEHRQWHKNVRCVWNGKEIVREAENDFDKDRLGLLDEFSDCVAACAVTPIDGQQRIVSVPMIENCELSGD